MDGDLEVKPGVVIPGHELDWSYTTSGGPGGQHANRSKTRVLLRFDVAANTSLPESVRTRLLEKLGPVVSVDVADQRSQWQNRRVARERLGEQVRAALVRPRTRRPTRPTKGSQRRRVASKRQRSEVKRNRRRPGMDS